jgi:hypothetical protein
MFPEGTPEQDLLGALLEIERRPADELTADEAAQMDVVEGRYVDTARVWGRNWPVQGALSSKATLATKSSLLGRATEPHNMENTMKQAVMACLALCLLAGAPAALAQTEQTDTAHTDTSVIGMPIYTSDGMMIGQVTTLGLHRGESSMIGEVGRLLGFGTRRVLIPTLLPPCKTIA